MTLVRPIVRRHLRSAIVLVAVLCLAAVILARLMHRGGIDLHGDITRLSGFGRAWVSDGCWPERLPIACKVFGRPWRVQNAGRAWSVRAARQGCGQRFELRAGDRWSKDARTGRSVERSELSDIMRQPMRRDIWLSFAMRVDPGPASTARWLNLGQLHNTPDNKAENGLSQIFTHGLMPNDRYFMRVRGSPIDPLRDSPPAVEIFHDDHFERGKVYAFRIRLRLDPHGDGLATVWRNGVKVADYRGPLSYVDRFGPYFKYGLYRPVAPKGETVSAHFSCLRIVHGRSLPPRESRSQ